MARSPSLSRSPSAEAVRGEGDSGQGGPRMSPPFVALRGLGLIIPLLPPCARAHMFLLTFPLVWPRGPHLANTRALAAGQSVCQSLSMYSVTSGDPGFVLMPIRYAASAARCCGGGALCIGSRSIFPGRRFQLSPSPSLSLSPSPPRGRAASAPLTITPTLALSRSGATANGRAAAAGGAMAVFRIFSNSEGVLVLLSRLNVDCWIVVVKINDVD